ncbi:hypothetical protein CDL12_24814 [Handroanthus impetiginosus]|uniref:Uncharacterized protein n=1 Tax=Handroanthus impetiginosus TaxID=429701 RepID=A0A2G9GBL1_9LAMI|nr:hypothetical protein CDL12_24814 [Handroanthus impetiginosus]
MDRILEFHNLESMRNAILIQEEVFRQQVHELHRLYNLQTKLMQELQNRLKEQKEAISQTETRHSHSFQALSVREDQKELSGSCSGEGSRIPIEFDLERPLESTPSCVYPSEEHKEITNIEEEGDVEVDLTLSIGRKLRSKSSKFCDFDESKKVGEVGSSTNKGGEECDERSSTVSVYQENTRPHWLLHDLSLNRT